MSCLIRCGTGVGSGPWSSLPQVGFKVFGVRAMVLGHIIVFRDNAAASDFWLWVHECVHVVQYARGSIKEFTKRYVEDHKSLEREADEFANEVTRTGQGRMERTAGIGARGRRLKDRICGRWMMVGAAAELAFRCHPARWSEVVLVCLERVVA